MIGNRFIALLRPYENKVKNNGGKGPGVLIQPVLEMHNLGPIPD